MHNQKSKFKAVAQNICYCLLNLCIPLILFRETPYPGNWDRKEFQGKNQRNYKWTRCADVSIAY